MPILALAVQTLSRAARENAFRFAAKAFRAAAMSGGGLRARRECREAL
jgi:hypothetical protein